MTESHQIPTTQDHVTDAAAAAAAAAAGYHGQLINTALLNEINR